MHQQAPLWCLQALTNPAWSIYTNPTVTHPDSILCKSNTTTNLFQLLSAPLEVFGITTSTAEDFYLLLRTILKIIDSLLLGSCITCPEFFWRNCSIPILVLAAYPDTDLLRTLPLHLKLCNTSTGAEILVLPLHPSALNSCQIPLHL